MNFTFNGKERDGLLWLSVSFLVVLLATLAYWEPVLGAFLIVMPCFVMSLIYVLGRLFDL